MNDTNLLIGSVYRCFKEASHAETLCNGQIWISTLETCKHYEDLLQGDPEEAHLIYNTGSVNGGSEDRNFVEIAARAGIMIGPGCSNISISDCTNTTRIPDGFVLCTTSLFDPATFKTFGEACVEIREPRQFFECVTRAMSIHHTITQAAFGSIIYQHREYTGLQSPPGPLGFVKPDRYSPQKEVRFLWLVESRSTLQPFLLNVPEVASLCRRIS